MTRQFVNRATVPELVVVMLSRHVTEGRQVVNQRAHALNTNTARRCQQQQPLTQSNNSFTLFFLFYFNRFISRVDCVVLTGCSV